MHNVSGEKTPQNNPIQHGSVPSQVVSKKTVPVPKETQIQSCTRSLSSRDIKPIYPGVSNADLVAEQRGKLDFLKEVVDTIFNPASLEVESKIVWLLNKDINVSILDNTALIFACKKQDSRLVNALVGLNADVNRKNKNLESPLFCAASLGNVDLVNFLLSHKANPNDSKKEKNPLLFLCSQLAKETNQEVIEKFGCIIRSLLKYEADPNVNWNGWTPLMFLCCQTHPDLTAIDLLLNANCDINVSYQYESPLILAACNPNPEIGIPILQKLIDKKVNVNAKLSITLQNRTAFEVILYKTLGRSKEVIQMLLNAGAQFRLLDTYAWEILIEAVEENPTNFTPELFECLVKSNIEELFIAREPRGKTALMYAAASGIFDIVNYMVSLSIPIDKQDVNGCTALDYAMAYGKSEVCHLLQEKMGLDQIIIPNFVVPKIHIAQNVYGSVNQNQGDEIRKRLGSKSAVEVTGITFDGEVAERLEGGACVSLTMKEIQAYFWAVNEKGCSWNSILEHMKKVSDISTFDWEQIRTEQAGYNTIRVKKMTPGVDYTFNKIQAVMNFYDWKIKYASQEIDVTNYSQAISLLKDQIERLSDGIFAFRLLQPADNEKLEVHGHSGFYLKMGEHCALFDPNIGLLDLTGTGAEAKIMLIQCQDLYDMYSVKLLRLYKLKDK